MTLVEILEKILNYTSIEPKLISNLRNGLSREEIQSKIRDFPFQIPQEVEELYQWHDGMKDSDSYDLFYHHGFLSLNEALEIREEWLQYNDEYIVYEPALLPLFEFEGEYYCVQCSDGKHDRGTIWFVYHDSKPVYNSLKKMFLAILECYETGAYQPFLSSEHGWTHVDTNVDKKQVAEIKLKHNLIRQERFNFHYQRYQKFYSHP